MKKFLILLTTLSIVFMGSSSYAFGKNKKTGVAPIPELVQNQNESESKLDKEHAKQTKKALKSEAKANSKLAKQKDKIEKSEQKVSKKIRKISQEKVAEENSAVNDSTKSEKKIKKNTKPVSMIEDTKQTREIQYVDNYYASMNKNRSALAMYLNPNLDIREVRASHILVKNRKDAIQIRKDIMEGKISFEEAARQYSLCPSGEYGGDLGFFDRKKMVQQFADTAFDLKIGEISKPVGTKFGWHIIKTTDKR
ncbi:peptidylprolyl isomerase [bacterium]|nr:peptidylprolyl isomerase [bacterium]